MNNIFQIGPQVYGASFVGRERQLQDLHTPLVDGSGRRNISLVGPPLTGKSSLVYTLLQQAVQMDPHRIYVQINLAHYEVYSDMWLSVMKSVLNHLKQYNLMTLELNECFGELFSHSVDMLQSSHYIVLLDNVRTIFNILWKANVKTVLIIDQFDEAQRLFEGQRKNFDFIRTIVSDVEYDVSTVLISRRMLHMIGQCSYNESTFHGVFELCSLSGFSREDMQDYFGRLERYGISLVEQNRQRLTYYAGTLPYLLSIFGKHIIEQHQQGQPIDIDEIYGKNSVLINKYYDSLSKSMTISGVMDSIVRLVAGQEHQVKSIDLDNLRSLGYLIKDDQGQNLVISGHFEQFILQRIKDSAQGMAGDELVRQEYTASLFAVVLSDKKKQGTGFFFKFHNIIYAITCAHVLQDKRKGDIIDLLPFHWGQTKVGAEITHIGECGRSDPIGLWAWEDIAILRPHDHDLELSEFDIQPLVFGTNPAIDGKCYCFGFHNERGKWCSDIVIGKEVADSYIEIHTTNLGPGFSGAPIQNAEHQLVGIVQAIKGAGVCAYMIPVNLIIQQLEKLREESEDGVLC